MCWLKSSLESKANFKCLCEVGDCILLLLEVKSCWEPYYVYVKSTLL